MDPFTQDFDLEIRDKRGSKNLVADQIVQIRPLSHAAIK